MIYISLLLWITYLAIEGLYDSYLYRFLPIRYRFNSKSIHVPHLFALLQRIVVLFLTVSHLNLLGIALNTVFLWLMLPFIQTGFYFEGHYWLTKWYKELKPVLDARGKPYRFFGYAHADSSNFPDKNPWLRLLYFVVGLTLFFIFNIAIL